MHGATVRMLQSSLSPFLCIGHTVPIFHSWGILSVVHIDLVNSLSASITPYRAS